MAGLCFYSVNSTSCQLYEFSINKLPQTVTKRNYCLTVPEVKNLTVLKSRY